MDAEVAAAMTQLESDQGRGEEASLESDVQKENAERAMGAQTTENAKTEKNANSLLSSPARVRPPRARRAGATVERHDARWRWSGGVCGAPGNSRARSVASDDDRRVTSASYSCAISAVRSNLCCVVFCST